MTNMVTIEEAQDVYRTAWSNYLLTEDEGRREVFGDVMDDAQEHCVTSKGPGPEWDTFIDTLPGFREHWDRWGNEMKEKVSRVSRCCCPKCQRTGPHWPDKKGKVMCAFCGHKF